MRGTVARRLRNLAEINTVGDPGAQYRADKRKGMMAVEGTTRWELKQLKKVLKASRNPTVKRKKRKPDGMFRTRIHRHGGMA